MMYTVETIKLFLLQLHFYALKENQEMNLQGTNIQINNNVVQSTGITYIYIYTHIYTYTHTHTHTTLYIYSFCLQSIRIF